MRLGREICAGAFDQPYHGSGPDCLAMYARGVIFVGLEPGPS